MIISISLVALSMILGVSTPIEPNTLQSTSTQKELSDVPTFRGPACSMANKAHELDIWQNNARKTCPMNNTHTLALLANQIVPRNGVHSKTITVGHLSVFSDLQLILQSSR
jgi:hypothetical protein